MPGQGSVDPHLPHSGHGPPLRRQTAARLHERQPAFNHLSVHWALCFNCFSSAVSWCSIPGTSLIAACTLDVESLVAAAAVTCISRTSQYPLGSAQAGTGWRVALAIAGLVSFSVAMST